MTSPGLQALQLEAYSSVCRAFYAQESLRWVSRASASLERPAAPCWGLQGCQRPLMIAAPAPQPAPSHATRPAPPP